MRVFVTGSAGLIGRAVVAHLRASGTEVKHIDLAPADSMMDADYAVCDIMNFDDVLAHMQGCDAVVHMAALRSPLNGPGEEVFRINTAGTFNVFEAAAKSGIRRVVQASSINAMGCAWNTGDFSPQYLPVDEALPTATYDPYSFSKQVVEEIGAYYWRRDRISGVAFRLPGIYSPELHDSADARTARNNMRRFMETFAALPQSEREQLRAQVHQECLVFRGARKLEYPAPPGRPTPPDGIDPLLWRAYTFDRYNLWAALDVRDAAAAAERALLADYEGSHSLFVSNAHNTLNYPSETLAQLFFPQVTQRKQPLNGTETLVNINRARELIGFEPQYPLRDEPQP